VTTTVEGMMKLGYPAYIIPALGLGKVLAIVAILWPGFPRLKEWAYAGIFFNMLGAIVSHVACKDPAWTVVVTVTIAALTLASWALRPQSRRLGDSPTRAIHFVPTARTSSHGPTKPAERLRTCGAPRPPRPTPPRVRRARSDESI